MEENKNPEIANKHDITCKNCAGKLEFKPGTKSLECPYCGTLNEIIIDKEKIREALREIDYVKFISDANNVETPKEESKYVKCQACGAETSVDAKMISSECPFCGTPLVLEKSQMKSLVTPAALAPFKIEQKVAIESFHKWMKKLWFLPNKTKEYAKPQKMQGIYTPYWTYDSNTTTHYSGQRGDDYQVTETYTDSSGQTQTRSVTKTRWTSVSGTVYVTFDDVLVVGSNSLPQKHVYSLQPWILNELIPYDKKFLSGFKSESYEVDVKNGFEKAKTIMDKDIVNAVNRNIGGDHQRITSKNVNYNNTTFKHILLPIWLSSYRFKDKVYRFVVNGQTGKVKGERPVSAMKIILLVLLVIAIIVAIVLLTQN
ncbi:MAG: hypothetical protein JXL97_10480 [Bacteroidales bacterium]|nr:hypothetical protein [Bacteroidales bacterium]